MEEKILIKGKKAFPTAYVIINILLISALIFLYKKFTLGLVSKVLVIAMIIIAITTFFVCFCMSLMGNIIVTDKKVCGCSAKYVKADIPIDNIESVNLVNPYNLSIKASVGQFVYDFNGFKNAKEITETINQLIHIKEETTADDLDELKKYKDLLDNGVINQEEFDTKKKQILGL